ncbi:MAG: sigma-70 family RNA polymerase sigma factor [Candidatus Omnitrophica bacterium]|nr:sigma-70 family RNA polymerase sigma factor [Candidatus Omnitrophota bacterium]
MLEASSAGDAHAINIFYERYSKLIYNAIHSWINKYAKDIDRIEDVKEIFQETILDIMKNSFARIKQARDPNRISGLIFLIAYQNAGKYFKKKWLEEKKRCGEEIAISRKDDLIDNLDREEKIRLVDKFRTTLTDEESRIMDLRYREEMKYREIAEKTGISTNNVGVILNRIKERLKVFINKECRANSVIISSNKLSIEQRSR